MLHGGREPPFYFQLFYRLFFFIYSISLKKQNYKQKPKQNF